MHPKVHFVSNTAIFHHFSGMKALSFQTYFFMVSLLVAGVGLADLISLSSKVKISAE